MVRTMAAGVREGKGFRLDSLLRLGFEDCSRHGYQGSETVHVDKRRRGTTTKHLWQLMKRRAAVEPTIGHLKGEHRLERNRLKGTAGDAINAILSAAAMNFRKLQGYFWRRLLDRFIQNFFTHPHTLRRNRFFQDPLAHAVAICLEQSRIPAPTCPRL